MSPAERPSAAPVGSDRDAATIGYRPALDGVRAVAVVAVLLFHGGAAFLPGGFLGVDAFFVLSGFLITSLLLAERARTGRIALAVFWGRRARRLLPALLVLLVVVGVVARTMLSPVEVRLLRWDALAALGYVANWRMTYRGTGYFAESAAPSPLQHTWSLGIEEQFYLLWPLVVIALLAIRPITRARAAMLVVCLTGTIASIVAAAWHYDPLDVDRAYYGTDSRAQALLVGCALAVWLSWPTQHGSPKREQRARWVGRSLGACSLAAAAGVGWIWTHATGTDAFLYHGGFTLAAVAVALVLAHVTLQPAAPIARALAAGPLVWLGRISYGVYLWHWPVFLYLTADRTGLTGFGLLTVRCAVAVSIAALSFVLIERPIRAATWPWRWPARRRLGAITGVSGCIAVTAALVTAATVPPRQSAPAPVFAAPAGHPAAGSGAGTAPMNRPGRRPGAEPRITFFGDSVAWSLGTYLPPHPGLSITVRAIQGCGIARLPDILQLGTPHTNYPGCTTWDRRWRNGVRADDPDVAVILLDRWELMDRRLSGAYQHVGEPAYDAYLTKELDLAIGIASSRGAHVVLLTAPYTHRAERPDGGLYDEDQPARVDAWNQLLRAAAARQPSVVTIVDLNARVCPDGRFTWAAGGVRLRSDGLHFTPIGVQRWIAPWLLPKLGAIAVGDPH